MTRGRKKDHTIPPTRSLDLQRNYRARKAQYIASLENRCHAAEEENVRLRKELETVRRGVPTVLSGEAATASAELMQNLASTTASLMRFQQVTTGVPSTFSYPTTSAVPSPPHPTGLSNTGTSTPYHDAAESNPDHDTDSGSFAYQQSHLRNTPSPTPSLGSSCCGGYIDCQGLVDGSDEQLQDLGHEPSLPHQSRTRVSGMRSTSENEAPSHTFNS